MKIFLDVGAHTGETIKVALESKYRFDRLYAFEPILKNCKVIRTFKDERIILCKYGLWNENCIMRIYNPGSMGASVYNNKWGRVTTSSQFAKFVRASDWFYKNLEIDDEIYLKLNCEGAEIAILDDLIVSGQYEKINVAMIDFDICKFPSKKHLAEEMKTRLTQLGIPKIFYADEFQVNGTHSDFTHSWLDKSMQ